MQTITIVQKNKSKNILTWYARVPDKNGKVHYFSLKTESKSEAKIKLQQNIKAVQTLMRHETVNLTLDTYAHILDTDTEKAISEVYS